MSRLTRSCALIVALALVFAFSPAWADTAQPTEGGGSISGQIIDQSGGIPIGGARVELSSGSVIKQTTKADSGGHYSFSNLAPAIYYVIIRSQGYQTARTDDIAVTSGISTTLRSALARATTSGQEPRIIGRVSARTNGNGTLSTATTINQSFSSELLEKEGYNRVGDALQSLPGVNIEGLSSSIGDSIQIDIRGFNSSETQTLLDGHPLGPLGAGSGGFDFQDSPSYAIGNTQVTYGSGALGLYGTDSIGGTIDMQTINPTPQREFLVSQGIGNQGKSFTDFQATGMVGDKFGYALVHGVLGAYGPYGPQKRYQPGLASQTGDFSPANIAANTYLTSGNYLLRNDMLKVKYDFSKSTAFTATALSANSWDDKSGNGDNCYYSYGLRLFQAQGAAQSPNSLPNPPALLPANAPALPNCPKGTVAATFDQLTQTCLTPQAYAKQSAGLNGGGPGPFQAHRFHDYHGRITTQLASNMFTLDAFGNRYSTDYNRNVNGSSYNTDYFDTTGFLLSDDIAGRLNDFGFGYYVQHQSHIGTYFDTNANQVFYGANSTPGQSYALGDSNFFVRNQYTPPGPLSVFLNAWLKRSTVTNKTTFDPRLSFVYRPTNADVIRLTGGRSDGEPGPDLLTGPVSFNQTPSNITANCRTQSQAPSVTTLTSVATASNHSLLPETSSDLEVAAGHRFSGDTIVQADAYFSFEKNRIFSGNLPTTAFPNVQIPANLLAQYLNRINGQCTISNASLADLAYSTNFNAASARFQGIELTGRYRLNPRLFFDYGYNIQSAVYLALPGQILQSNVFDVNGAQINHIPLHKASFGLDYQDRHGFEARLDGYYYGENNSYARPAFFYGNVTVSKTLARGTTLNIGVQNLFDSASSSYFLFGAAPYAAENSFGTDVTALDQQNSQGIGQTGLLPPQVTFSLTQRI